MTPTPDTRTPVLSPGIQLLRSRKTIVALVTALVTVIVLLVPSLQAVQGELITILTILGSVLIASISWEDGKEKGAPTTVTTGSAETVNVNQQPEPPSDETDTRPLDIPPYRGNTLHG